MVGLILEMITKNVRIATEQAEDAFALQVLLFALPQVLRARYGPAIAAIARIRPDTVAIIPAALTEP